MNIRKYIVLVLLVAFFSTGGSYAQYSHRTTSAQVVDSKQLKTHKVAIGETVYSIAVANNTTEKEIIRLNPGSDKGIKAGQILYVPVVDKQIETTKESSSKVVRHIISTKETLYSVSKKYNITEAELRAANPGLNESNFKIGKEIIIPAKSVVEQNNTEDKGIKHKVAKKETLFSISQKYNVPVEDIRRANPSIEGYNVRSGSTIIIPQNSAVEDEHYQSQRFLPQDGIVRVALLLPFKEGSKSVEESKIKAYYEGFLLAVQRMKERGLNAEIYTFDIGTDTNTDRLKSIMETYEMKNLDLVIGGISDKQIQMIGRFSETTRTPYVVPFGNKNTGVESNRNIFQIGNSHSSQYSKIAKAFRTKFSGANIIFVTENGSNKDKMDFVKVLQKELKDSGISYKVAPTTASITDDLGAVIDQGRKNVIVPTSSTDNSLGKIVAGLEVIQNKGADISLFGYPEWQIYTNRKPQLHQLNSIFYSMFYFDEKNPESQLFSDRYKNWYNQKIADSFPKYPQMGYDTGILFLSALQKYKTDFPERINDVQVNPLQTALYFEPVGNEGGYINTGIYFVNFRPDGSVVKNEINVQ